MMADDSTSTRYKEALLLARDQMQPICSQVYTLLTAVSRVPCLENVASVSAAAFGPRITPYRSVHQSVHKHFKLLFRYLQEVSLLLLLHLDLLHLDYLKRQTSRQPPSSCYTPYKRFKQILTRRPSVFDPRAHASLRCFFETGVQSLP